MDHFSLLTSHFSLLTLLLTSYFKMPALAGVERLPQLDVLLAAAVAHDAVHPLVDQHCRAVAEISGDIARFLCLLGGPVWVLRHKGERELSWHANA